MHKEISQSICLAIDCAQIQKQNHAKLDYIMSYFRILPCYFAKEMHDCSKGEVLSF